MTGHDYFVHPTAVVDDPVDIGAGTKIWHFCHISTGAKLGANCNLGQNVFLGRGVRLGSNVKIQNNVSVYEGVTLEDDVFCGPSCVFTNIANPRAQVSRRGEYVPTLVRRGASLGANATIVCGATIGRYAFVGAGAVVTRGAVADYSLMIGVPAQHAGWVGRHGHVLTEPDADGVRRCPETGWRYREEQPFELRCLDWDEDRPLPQATTPRS